MKQRTLSASNDQRHCLAGAAATRAWALARVAAAPHRCRLLFARAQNVQERSAGRLLHLRTLILQGFAQTRHGLLRGRPVAQ